VVRVEAVELLWLDLHRRSPHRAAHGTVVERPVIVARALVDGGEGWGECAALAAPTYRAEHAGGAWLVLQDHLVPRLLEPDRWRAVGAPGDEPAEGTGSWWRDPVARHAAWAVGRVLSDVRGHQMAKACLEMAVLDAVLRQAGRSLADALGVQAATVPAGAVVDAPVAADGERAAIGELVERATEAAGAGFSRLRLKIWPGWDVVPLRAVRTALPEVLLQADANASYRRDDAGTLAGIDPLGLVCLEQPLAVDDLVGHAALARRLATPVCLDEALGGPADVETVASLGAARVVCLKPPCLGGVDAAARALELGRRAGLTAWCGGMLQTALGRAVDAAVSGLPGIGLPGDLGAPEPPFVEDDPFGAVPVRQGAVRLHRDPGVGPLPDLVSLRSVVSRRVLCRRQGPRA